MTLIKENVHYTKPVGESSTYDVYEVNGQLISVDKNEFVLAEKYRPRIIEDLVLPEKEYKTVEAAIAKGVIPNMLFFSSTGGTGKDSIISVLSNNIPMTLLTINASIERGIDVIKERVVKFARTNSLDGTRKTIYLTEAGGLTNIATDSLKAIIEDHSARMSFLMTTNSMNNISHALQSRFQMFDMNEIAPDQRKALVIKLYQRLQAILSIEEIEYAPQDLQALILKYFPSYRELIVALEQSTSTGKLKLQDDTSGSMVDDVIDAINAGDYSKCVFLSEKINVTNFANQMKNRHTKGLLVEPQMLVSFIPAMDALQQAIQRRVPFLGISFSVFCLQCINAKIKMNR
jgi:DNA polymerase III delta prime subunit